MPAARRHRRQGEAPTRVNCVSVTRRRLARCCGGARAGIGVADNDSDGVGMPLAVLDRSTSACAACRVAKKGGRSFRLAAGYLCSDYDSAFIGRPPESSWLWHNSGPR